MPSTAIDCLKQPAAFVIDGANRICRLGDNTAPVQWLATALACVCIAAVLLAWRPRAYAKVWLAIAMALPLVAIVPGLIVTALGRADAPWRVQATTQLIQQRMNAFATAAQGLSCVDITHDS